MPYTHTAFHGTTERSDVVFFCTTSGSIVHSHQHYLFFTTMHATIYSTLTHNAIIDTVSESAHFSDTYFTTNQRLHRCNRQGNMYWKQINEIILNLSARLIIGLMKNCSSCYPLGMSLQSTYEKENRVKTLPAGVCCDSAEMASSLP